MPAGHAKIRKQERGHEYAEQQLIASGAPVMRAGQKPAAWLAEALRAAGGRTFRHPGCIRYAFRLGTTRAQRRGVYADPAPEPYPKSEVLVTDPELLALAA